MRMTIRMMVIMMVIMIMVMVMTVLVIRKHYGSQQLMHVRTCCSFNSTLYRTCGCCVLQSQGYLRDKKNPSVNCFLNHIIFIVVKDKALCFAID